MHKYLTASVSCNNLIIAFILYDDNLHVTIFKDSFYIPIKRYDVTVDINKDSKEIIETETNTDGTPKKVIYYKDNVYNGSIDYFYEGDSVYEIHFDENDQLFKSIKKRVNEIGSIIYESYSSATELLREVEYTYYDDLATVWKKLTTEHEEDKVIKTKELYTEDGLLTDKYVYEDSVEVSHIVYTYDENGEIVNEEEKAA